jgi:hypothetical protein
VNKPIASRDVKQATPLAVYPFVSTVYNSSWLYEILANEKGMKFIDYSVHNDQGETVAWMWCVVHYHRFRASSIDNHSLAHVTRPEFPGLQYAEDASLRSTKMFSLTSQLLAQFPRRTSITLTLHDNVDESIVAAFEAAGFKLTRQATYLFDPPEISPETMNTEDYLRIIGAHHEGIWKDAKKKMRTDINSARRKGVTVVGGDDSDGGLTPHQFDEFLRECLQSKGKASHFDITIVKNVIDICVRKGQGRIIAAVSSRGIEAASAFIWDWNEGRCYYWTGACRKDVYDGSAKLVIMEGMKFASMRGLVFDLDGESYRNKIMYENVRGKPGSKTAAKQVFRMTASRITTLDGLACLVSEGHHTITKYLKGAVRSCRGRHDKGKDRAAMPT